MKEKKQNDKKNNSFFIYYYSFTLLLQMIIFSFFIYSQYALIRFYLNPNTALYEPNYSIPNIFTLGSMLIDICLVRITTDPANI